MGSARPWPDAPAASKPSLPYRSHSAVIKSLRAMQLVGFTTTWRSTRGTPGITETPPGMPRRPRRNQGPETAPARRVHDRLWLLARQKRPSLSAVAVDILDKNVPH